MIPPSAKDLIRIGSSKYAVVIAVAKRARQLSEEKRNEENYRLSTMVSEALDDVINSRILIEENNSQLRRPKND